RTVELGLDGKEIVVIKAKVTFGRARFEPGKVWDGSGEMDGRRGTNRTQWVVGHEVDIVGLAPPGDLHRFSKAADIADVEPIELVDAAFDVRHELPLARKFLTNGEGDIGHR